MALGSHGGRGAGPIGRPRGVGALRRFGYSGSSTFWRLSAPPLTGTPALTPRRVPGSKNGGRSPRRHPAAGWARRRPRRGHQPSRPVESPVRKMADGPPGDIGPLAGALGLPPSGARIGRGSGRARSPSSSTGQAPVVASVLLSPTTGGFGWFWGQGWGQQVDLWERAGDLAKTLDHDLGSARRCRQASQGGRSGRRHRRFVHRGHRSPAGMTGTGKAPESQPEREARKPPGGPRVTRRAWSWTDREAPRSWSASAFRLLGVFYLLRRLSAPPPTGTPALRPVESPVSKIGGRSPRRHRAPGRSPSPSGRRHRLAAGVVGLILKLRWLVTPGATN